MKQILVFVPDCLNLNKCGLLEGVRKDYEECEAFYITNNVPVKEISDNIIGYLSDDFSKFKKASRGLFIEKTSGKVTLLNTSAPFVKILYDFKAFRACENLNPEINYGEHFRFLSQNLRKHRLNSEENGRKTAFLRFLIFCSSFFELLLTFFSKTKFVWTYSATVSHFYENLNGHQLFLKDVIKQKTLSPKSGNFLLAKLFDLALGIFILKFFLSNEGFFVRLIEEVREVIISNFRDLLIYLMGSPIGLKLNYSLNNSLGTFFFYHISLWRIFLTTMQPYIKEYFRLLVLPGAFGFSFQIAMLSDLISIATFHVYCIYVYAARLIYLQLKGLFALWRLFIGRKYNPLRERVDSHQYSHHQLFIGTLAFTILLFLLPTTTMYYTVFVIFRLAILILEEILIKIRFLLHCFPLYLLILFLVKSPMIAGPVCLRTKKSKDGAATFQANLKMLPIMKSLRQFSPEVIKTSNDLSLKKIFTGVLV